jgi:hypothetical protein
MIVDKSIIVGADTVDDRKVPAARIHRLAVGRKSKHRILFVHREPTQSLVDRQQGGSPTRAATGMRPVTVPSRRLPTFGVAPVRRSDPSQRTRRVCRQHARYRSVGGCPQPSRHAPREGPSQEKTRQEVLKTDRGGKAGQAACENSQALECQTGGGRQDLQPGRNGAFPVGVKCVHQEVVDAAEEQHAGTGEHKCSERGKVVVPEVEGSGQRSPRPAPSPTPPAPPLPTTTGARGRAGQTRSRHRARPRSRGSEPAASPPLD